MSDPPELSIPLAGKLGYVNTWYHKKPKLDISCVDSEQLARYEFLISSEVFEHLPHDLLRPAFLNCKRLLRSSGFMIFTVPYDDDPAHETIEHFPDLHRYKIVWTPRGRLLVNTTRTGERQVFDHLTFHGGRGNTLEHRLFGIKSLREHFHEAGFSSIEKAPDEYLPHGIAWRHQFSRPLIVS